MIGKLIGGAIGFMFGGPLGALAGTVFGHAVDSSDFSPSQNETNPISCVEQYQLAFFVGTFSMLAKLAASDGPVKCEETEAVTNFGLRELGLSARNQSVAMNIYHAALRSPARFEDFAAQFCARFQHNLQVIETVMDILIRVSLADGPVNRAEETLLSAAAGIFGIPRFHYERMRSRYMAVLDKAYSVLGCGRQDSDDEIKRCYRRMVQAYHPDKIAAKDLPHEFTRLAQDKFREIQSAYEEIKKERGLM